MATKIKGIYKGFKFISQIFGGKGYCCCSCEGARDGNWVSDRCQTCGTHRLGWPFWHCTELGPEFTATSIGNSRGSNPTPLSTWSSQDFEQSMGCQPATEMIRDLPSMDLPNIPKKQKRKKKKTSSPKCSSSKSSRTSKTKATYTQLDSSTEPEI